MAHSAEDARMGSGKNDVSPSAVAGVKRLLPAFEPSSPSLPKAKRRATSGSPAKDRLGKQKYPTPVPTSSTGILPSSPLQPSSTRRAGLQRSFSTYSALSERNPLCAVPSIELDESGEPMLMGRSSESSHYQLSVNKLISRVHVRAVYLPAQPPESSKVEIRCLGWNAIKIHCQGKAWELGKETSFTSDAQGADIMLDVQDARVVIKWPRIDKHESTFAEPDPFSSSDEENPSQRSIAAARPLSPSTSPVRQRQQLRSPVSPSPAMHNALASSSTIPALNLSEPIVVYEDDQSDEGIGGLAGETQSTQIISQPSASSLGVSQSTGLTDPNDFSDPDEENDPIIHSFGPFGDNLLPRMASITASGPLMSDDRIGGPNGHVEVGDNHGEDVNNVHNKAESTPSPPGRVSSETTRGEESDPIVNHVINQLAYSRLSSTPISTIMNNLPDSLKIDSPRSKENRRLTSARLRQMLERTNCIGEITREGKDAAGKPLESEYYYIPDMDVDDKRRDAVVEGLKKPGLRACRKEHKQYYWRKPK